MMSNGGRTTIVRPDNESTVLHRWRIVISVAVWLLGIAGGILLYHLLLRPFIPIDLRMISGFVWGMFIGVVTIVGIVEWLW